MTRLKVPTSGLFQQAGYHVWCGSTVRGQDGEYHFYYSRWPEEHGFNAWLTHSEIARASGPSPTGPFTFREVALPGAGGDAWDAHNTHNVTIVPAEGRYWLYYTGTRGDKVVAGDGLNWLHRNHQRIGVAVADRPEGPWERTGPRPLIDVAAEDSAPHGLMIANPTVTSRPGGGYLMVLKAVGNQAPLPLGGPVVHLTATADQPDGPFTVHTSPFFTRPGVNFPAEDPFLFRRGGRYYLIMKDMGRYFSPHENALLVASSENGFDWPTDDLPVLTGKTVHLESEGEVRFARLERPQLFFDDDGLVVLNVACLRESGQTCCLQIPLDAALTEALFPRSG